MASPPASSLLSTVNARSIDRCNDDKNIIRPPLSTSTSTLLASNLETATVVVDSEESLDLLTVPELKERLRLAGQKVCYAIMHSSVP